MARNNQAVTTQRWLARLLSVGTFLFIGTFVVGELIGGDSTAPRHGEWLGLLFFPIGLVVGLAVAWKRERLGGVIAVLSTAAFYMWNYFRSGKWPTGLWFLVVPSPAVIFIIVSLINESKKRR